MPPHSVHTCSEVDLRYASSSAALPVATARTDAAPNVPPASAAESAPQRFAKAAASMVREAIAAAREALCARAALAGRPRVGE